MSSFFQTFTSFADQSTSSISIIGSSIDCSVFHIRSDFVNFFTSSVDSFFGFLNASSCSLLQRLQLFVFQLL
uniref:Ovule protein n=1 Tax=Panagrolaimus sp. JU765 TaxID=591449 RepID=A0AC34QHQ1_9BILA